MATGRRERNRHRRAYRPRFEAMEARCTPTTLPGGFTETAVVSGLNATTAMDFAPDGRLFVLEQSGNVKLIRGDGTTWTALHLNVDSTGERGVLGIAFDPSFATNHYVYLYYTNPNAGASPWATGEHNQLSRFTVDDSTPSQPLFTNEAPVLDWDDLSAAANHNGGAIHFGLDGMLYADAGDNAQTFTQGGNTYRVSQTLTDLLGKQLRIDVAAFNQGLASRDDTTVGHLIPSDNPFVGKAPGIDQLIFVLGLRNPYTFAVQPGTGKIFINDVGESTWEEIDQSTPGANVGWSGGNTDGFGQSPAGLGVSTDPLLAYNHSGGPAGGGVAITGGAFYDPTTPQFPAAYTGKYFYADLSGWIRVFDPANPGTAANPDTSSAFASGIVGRPIDLKLDSSGSLYVLIESGAVEKISYTAPVINTQPIGQTAGVGESVRFAVTAGGPALTYQWQHLVGASWHNVGTNTPTFAIAGTTTADAGDYRVIVANSEGSVTSQVVALTVNPAGASAIPGLQAAFYDFRAVLRRTPRLIGRVPTTARVDPNIDYPPTRLPWTGPAARSARSFAVEETGFLTVPASGRYRLSLRSKDGGRLRLDGHLLVDDAGIHPVRTQGRTITLTAGDHPLQVDSFASTGIAALILEWSGPGIAKQVVPASALSHGTAATPTPTGG